MESLEELDATTDYPYYKFKGQVKRCLQWHKCLEPPFNESGRKIGDGKANLQRTEKTRITKL